MNSYEQESKATRPKACIVTLFRSLNFGAFLQAYAMQQVLRRRGLHPVFLDIYGVRQNIKRLFVLIKPKDVNFDGLAFALRKWKVFSDSEKKHLALSESGGPYAACFVGSDEIWNVSNSSFVSVPVFFGDNITGTSNIFCYAPSCGNADVDELVVDEGVLKGMVNFSRISVRDESTYQFAVRARPNMTVARVLDPTFLYDFSDEEEKIAFPDRYCVLYSYQMNSEKIKEIRRYARRNNLVLLSPGFHNSWCDEVVPCSPFQFLTLIKNAHSVITDTYHGTIFSIKYRKNFASYYEDKEKVRDLLKEMGLQNSGYVAGALDKVKDIETDYSIFDSLFRNRVTASNRFLDDCVSLL